MADKKVLLNFVAKFRCEFMIARVKLQNCCAAFCSSEGEDGVQVRYYE